MSTPIRHLSMSELEAALPRLLEAPADDGTLRWVVARPDIEAREVLAEGLLDPDQGLVGDGWQLRGHPRTDDGGPLADAQIALMSSRVALLLACTEERVPLAGDQLYVDLDLSEANLAPGTLLSIGDATLQITAEPHRGCKKFMARFGPDALMWVNAKHHAGRRLRGVYAKVVQGGRVRPGDRVRKVAAPR